jgi:hypothetical protein
MEGVDPPSSPKLSIVVVFHAMARQAENALRSLCVPFQRGVTSDDYEIVAVENVSTDLLGEERARSFGPNVRYFLRDETGVSPVPAATFGYGEARGGYVGLVLDGAHVFTPRLVQQALFAARVTDEPVVLVPTHHLGARVHHEHRAANHDAEREAELLRGVDWYADGYRLFAHAVPSPEFEHGVFTPRTASACVFFRRETFDRRGGLDAGFDLPGGGLVAAHLYALLASEAAAKVILLWGEGAFHKFHSGTYTSERDDRAALLVAANRNFRRITGAAFPPAREPTVLGPVCSAALPFVGASVNFATMYNAICREQGKPAWPRDA